jgi:hypothetical protein
VRSGSGGRCRVLDSACCGVGLWLTSRSGVDV